MQNRDEYESGDTSDEEDRVNTAGEVPRSWYDEYPHVGYDTSGRRLLRPAQRDRIDDFLKKCEDPDFWRTVTDPSTGQDVVLSQQDLELLSRIKEGRVPNAQHEEYEPWVEWFSREVMVTPLRAFPEHKRSFLPSDSERKQISKLVHALRCGWTQTRKERAKLRREAKTKKFYDLWGSGPAESSDASRRHMPAPRRLPPAHAESYNPPPEYMLDRLEMKEWNKLATTPWKRKYTFLPTKHDSLRRVGSFPRFTRERFLRCLDLYLAPRAIKMRLDINRRDLVPELPSPRSLQPFPTKEVLCFRGHADVVRSCDFDPSGQYAVSGSDDGTVKVWEVQTGRCLRTVELGEAVVQVLWGPARGLSAVLAVVGARLMVLNPGADIGAHKVALRTDRLLQEPPPQHDVEADDKTRGFAAWQQPDADDWAKGIRIVVGHRAAVKHASVHPRGDYVACAGARLLVHQLSKRRSQVPLARPGAPVHVTAFHPARPLLAAASQRSVRIYDLVKQQLVKRLLTGAQWISDIAIHPGGDNLLVSSYDRKCMWFDLDLSSSPYQTLRLHGKAVRAVCFHPRYPLCATAGDDPYLVVTHATVYNDLLQNPLIVPLKQLPAPPAAADLRVLGLRFHPRQPWLLAAAADHTLRLYA